MTEQDALACHEEAQQLHAEGRYEEAAAGFERAAAYFAEADGAQSPDLANVLDDYAESLLALCRYESAEQAARQACQIVAAILNLLDPETRAVLAPRAFSVWGTALRELGRYEQASAPLLEAIHEAEQCFGAESAEVASHLNNYGVLCKYWGKFEEGERRYLRALGLLEAAYGKDSLETATI